jgi:DNA-directed RNA polymerase subunit M/transcription elongation factor TFIIS
MNDKRSIAVAKLRAKGIPESYEDIVFSSNVPYEDTMRKILRGLELNDALGVIEIADSVTPCPKCKSLKVTENSVQTRSADEGATSFYTCIKCHNSWKG